MAGRITVPPMSEEGNRTVLPLGYVAALLDTMEKPLIVVERSGNILMVNSRARQCLESQGYPAIQGMNLFSDLLQEEPRKVFDEIEKGEHVVLRQIQRGKAKSRVRVQWMPQPDWLVLEIENKSEAQPLADPATQLTVQDLLQEREITYRNLLAAYLKLQEVNRQKTVFLASAAHELKTPLAVIKGYYDLLLAGSLGRLTDKQRDILEESKESCERLVRLVSMFLNYSALESGKLVLQLRENDLRDCLDELSKRWFEAFQRKGVRLEAKIDPSIPTFRFDYQKVQQVAANLLDNSLKHSPSGGTVVLRAAPHFRERRVATMAPLQERRRFRLPRPNSVEVSVKDFGTGISAEHHNEIFEDFVRATRHNKRADGDRPHSECDHAVLFERSGDGGRGHSHRRARLPYQAI